MQSKINIDTKINYTYESDNKAKLISRFYVPLKKKLAYDGRIHKSFFFPGCSSHIQ